MRRWLPLLLLCGAFPVFTLLEHVEVIAVGGGVLVGERPRRAYRHEDCYVIGKTR